MTDPDLIGEAAARKLDISLVTGAEIDELLTRAAAASPRRSRG